MDLPIALDTASWPLTLQVPQCMIVPPSASILALSSSLLGLWASTIFTGWPLRTNQRILRWRIKYSKLACQVSPRDAHLQTKFGVVRVAKIFKRVFCWGCWELRIGFKQKEIIWGLKKEEEDTELYLYRFCKHFLVGQDVKLIRWYSVEVLDHVHRMLKHYLRVEVAINKYHDIQSCVWSVKPKLTGW